MNRDERIIQKIEQQTLGGQAALLKFYTEVLSEEPDDIRQLELTYFALSVSAIFYLQFGNQKNKNELLNTAMEKVIEKNITSFDEEIDIEQAITEYRNRLDEYSNLIADLLNKNTEGSPIVSLFTRFYEYTSGKSAQNQAFRTIKVGKVISQYIIDSIKFAQNELRTEA